jgi:hypothetical protein
VPGAGAAAWTGGGGATCRGAGWGGNKKFHAMNITAMIATAVKSLFP